MRTFKVLVLTALFCGISLAIRNNVAVEDTNELRLAIREDIVSHVNSLKTTWTASSDQGPFFEGMTFAQAKSLMGTMKLGTSLPPKKPSANLEALPDNFDVREKWPQCASMFRIRDQSACGACWAFSTSEAMSDRVCVAHNKNVSLSAAQINSCSGCGYGCEGGFPDQVWQYWVDSGVVTESCSPYTLPSCDHHVANSTNPCPTNEYPTPACVTKCNDTESWDSSLHYGKSAYGLASVQDIMQDIYTYGSVQTAYMVYEDFLTYKSGVYHHVTGTAVGGHAVKVIGWGVDNGTPYWLVANSWNTHWGDNGFFKIQRGNDECGFEDGFNAGLPK